MILDGEQVCFSQKECVYQGNLEGGGEIGGIFLLIGFFLSLSREEEAASLIKIELMRKRKQTYKKVQFLFLYRHP